MKSTVSVIGAGTAGLIAARELCRKDIKVSIYDQKSVPGSQIHASGILSLSGLKTLDVDYHKASTNRLYGANIHAGGENIEIRSKEAKACVLDRKELNEICIEEAVREGVRMNLGKRVTGTELDVLHASSIILGADGAFSSVAAHFGMGSIGRYVLTYKAEFNVGGRGGVVDLFFDRETTPGLFGWLCPNSEDILEVGVGIDSKKGNAKKAFERFIKTKEITKIIDGARMIDGGASMIPISRREQVVDNVAEVLLVGDSAGQVKASTGGGIIFGSNAAIIAAEEIQRHIEDGTSLASYEKRFVKEYGLDMALHKVINSLYSRIGNRSIGIGLKCMRWFGVDSFLGKYGDMDRPSLMIKRALLRSA
jgi:flavin-dependent dehydrogenase